MLRALLKKGPALFGQLFDVKDRAILAVVVRTLYHSRFQPLDHYRLPSVLSLLLTEEISHGATNSATDGTVRQRIEAGAECTCACRRADEVLQHHVPANYKGNELPHRDVAVHIRRSRSVWDSNPELCIASPWEQISHYAVFIRIYWNAINVKITYFYFYKFASDYSYIFTVIENNTG